MNKQILYIFFLFLSLFAYSPTVNAQTYDTISAKEDFDCYNDYVVYSRHKVCTINPNKDAFVFGDGMSKILEGYLDLYDATGDKAYLYKFVMQSLCIVENRNDINPESVAKTPKWTETSASTYTDGYIIASFAKFIFYIKELYPELMSEELVQFDELKPDLYQLNTCNCNYTGMTFETFGDYAIWLEQRVSETLDYFIDNKLWSDTHGMLGPGGELIVNMQTGFARALLFMGLSSGNSDYLNKAKIIAALHKSNVAFKDRCTKKEYSATAFVLNEEKNSYWWYHMGWRVIYRECVRSLFFKVPNYNHFTSYVEDVNHGAIVMLFPYDYYKYADDTVFNHDDMCRFRNTFTKNIYSDGKYNMAVDGSNGTTYIDAVYDSVTLANVMKYFSPVYARWAEFDGADASTIEPNVYDLVMSDYVQHYYNQKVIPTWYSGQKTMGHAMIIKEQWKREKVNLHLSNRDLVYNQDFNVVGNIIIDPNYCRPRINPKRNPYAEPKSFLDGGDKNRFVIESDVEVNISAGESVRIKQGFHAKKGAIVRIRVAK